MLKSLVQTLVQANAQANVADITIHVTAPILAMVTAMAMGITLAAVVRRPEAYGIGGYAFSAAFALIAAVTGGLSGNPVAAAALLPLAGLAYTLSYRLDPPLVPQPISSDTMRHLMRLV